MVRSGSDNKNLTNTNHNTKLDNLKKINRDYFPSGFDTRILSPDPYIVKLRRFINTDEINALLEMAKGRFERSTIVVDGEMVLSTTRTSETAFITDDGHYEQYNSQIKNILKKVCYLLGCSRNQIEALMVVKYGDKKEYRDHWDFFEPEDNMDNGNNRMATFFVYLSSLDEDEGGETEFPLVGIKAKPSKGTAVFWWNMTPDGRLIRDTLHRGNPVLTKNKVKYGLNIWIREYEF